jgi:hypothetical protein
MGYCLTSNPFGLKPISAYPISPICRGSRSKLLNNQAYSSEKSVRSASDSMTLKQYSEKQPLSDDSKPKLPIANLKTSAPKIYAETHGFSTNVDENKLISHYLCPTFCLITSHFFFNLFTKMALIGLIYKSSCKFCPVVKGLIQSSPVVY